MSRKKYSIGIAVLVLLISVIMILLLHNESIAAPFKLGWGNKISTLLNNKQLYCIDHGLEFKAGEYFCTSIGAASPSVAYAVANQTNENRSKENDLWANIIWSLFGSSTNPSVDISAELDNAKAAEKVKPSGNIGIETPSDSECPLIDEGKGYGPFKIIYPEYKGNPVGNVEIKVNGKKYELPGSGKEFYLTEADGVIYGQVNYVEVTFEGVAYSGTAYYLSPEVSFEQTFTCRGCGVSYKKYLAKGAFNDAGKVVPNDCDWTTGLKPVHGTIKKNGEEVECPYSWNSPYIKEGEPYATEIVQRLVYVEPIVTQVKEKGGFSFWAGKSPILIDLNKVNTKDEAISDATFQADVTGALKGSSFTAGGQSKLGPIIARKDVDTVKIVLREIYAPDDYIKIKEPITITCTWNKGSKEWSYTIDYEGKEKIEVESSENIHSLSDPKFIIKIKMVDRPTIKVQLDKKDTLGNTVPVSFSVSVVGGQVRDGSGTLSDGGVAIIEPDIGVTSVEVTLTENDPGEKFVKYNKPIKLRFTSDGKQSSWSFAGIEKPTKGDGTDEKIDVTEDGNNKVTIYAINRRTIIVELIKTDNSKAQNPIEGLVFDLSVTGGRIRDGISSVTTNSSGYAKIIIEPDGEGPVSLTLKERYNPYYIDEGPIIINFTYSGGSWTQSTAQNPSNILKLLKVTGSQFEFEVTLQNRAKIEDIRIVKFNRNVEGEKIPGITFKFEFSNARTLSGASTTTATTGSDGTINLGIIEIIDPTQDVTITVTEIGVPTTKLNFHGFYLERGSIVITLRHRKSGSAVITGISSDMAVVEYDPIANIVSMKIDNIVTLDLEGRVWEDIQHGVKPVTPPNGTIDSDESGVEKVKVDVKDENGKVIQTTLTDANGNYIFKDLPASVFGVLKYYIEFTYDGIHYIVTPYSQKSGDSVVQEIDRDAFNKRFATITKGKSNDGTTLEYTYDSTSATLIVTDANGVVLDKFAMVATTLPNIYFENTSGINMGLVRKEVDLAAVTDINNAKVTINAKERIYDYNTLISLDNNITIDDPEASYNLYLYKSDYNYRIDNYSQLPILKASGNLTDPANQTLQSSEYDDLLNKKKEDQELKVQLTYDILLNNQSATDAVINEIAYYYDDSVLELVTNIPITETFRATINGKSYRGIRIPTQTTFAAFSQAKTQLVFNVKEDANENIILGDIKNWVEITSYSTTVSCIDKDSAPDNIEEHYVEDDSDDARTLTIQLNIEDRVLEGQVFDDSNKDGLLGDNEQRVNDVIVQLIEVKNVNNKKLEYIWQETTSGSNTVKRLSNDGKYVYIQNNGVTERGKYRFEDFIPGNYIVRFIYGDGTYYDKTIAGETTSTEAKQNIRVYNGQDFKSTIDNYYNKSPYNIVSYAQNASKARDNEARRLEEMAYATSETNVNYLRINVANPVDIKTQLQNTWMCAETSNIQIPITGIDTDPVPDISAINLGLIKRPQAELRLEKHVTHLQVGDVATASANIEDYYKKAGTLIVKTTDTNKGVIASGTSKEADQIGLWHVETEISNIIGKRIDITYSYLIKNNGDPDYISITLFNWLEDNNYSYSNIAQEVKKSSRQTGYITGEYLGNAYYTGIVTNKDVEMGATFKIEDYLHLNQLSLKLDKFNENTSTEEKEKWVSSGVKGKETVRVVKTNDDITLLAGNKYVTSMDVYNDNMSSSSSGKELTYRSYAAQLIPGSRGMITTRTGTLMRDTTLGDLQYVQADIREISLGAGGLDLEGDEFIGEIVEISQSTGGDEKSPIMLIVSIAGGLAIITVGIILIKKFIIK